MPDGQVAQEIYKDILKHPIAIALATMLFGGGAGLIVQPFVLASDFNVHVSEFKELRGEIKKLGANQCVFRKELTQYTIEGTLRTNEKEMYELEGVIESGEATERDRLRLRNLQAEKAKLERQLTALTQVPACDGD
jgi:hypothetical protein